MFKELAFQAGYTQGLMGNRELPEYPWWLLTSSLKSSFLCGFEEAMYKDNE